MICPKCKSESIRVVDNVKNPNMNEIYRMRKCKDCGHVFYTVEIEAEMDKRFNKDWNKYHRK